MGATVKPAGKLINAIKRDDPIVKYEGEGRAILRQVCKPVAKVTEEYAELAEVMGEIMYASNGIGLAAPQVGIMQRLFVYDAGDGLQMLINPSIIQKRGAQIGSEGCLSLPGLYGDVERASHIVVKGVDQFGHPVRLRVEGMTARVIQHEYDHLDGVLFIDHADPETLHIVTPGDHAEDDEALEA